MATLPAESGESGESREKAVSPPDWTFRLFAGHLWWIFGIWVSNYLLAGAVLSDLWRRWRGLKALPATSTASGPSAWLESPNARLPFLLYVVLLGLSIATSYSPRRSLDEAGEILTLVALPLAFVVLRSAERVRLLIDGLGAVTAFLAVLGLGQLLIGYGDLEHRITGPFSHYMTFAGVLLVADLLLIARIVSRRQRWSNWRDWRWPALLVINIALFGSLTRGAWVALFVTLGVLALVRAPRLLLALLPAAALVVVLAPDRVQQRIRSIADLNDPSNYDRLCMAEAGFRMIAERPLFGLGPGMVAERYPIYRQPTAPRQTVKHLHNTYIQLAAERGLLALAAYLWMIGAAIFMAYRGYRRAVRGGDGEANQRGLYLGAFLALVAFSVAGLFEANWRDTEVQRLVMFLVAVPYVLKRMGREQEALPSPAAESGE